MKTAEYAADLAAVRAEMRPGGHPLDMTIRLHLTHRMSESEGVALTNEVFRNLENRLVFLEGLFDDAA